MLDVLEVFADHASHVWCVRYRSGPTRASVLDAFGTDTLPTPFRCGDGWNGREGMENGTPLGYVLAVLHRNHPGAHIDCAPDRVR